MTPILLAKKSLGQHFLRSEKALLQMKESIGSFSDEIKNGEVVIFEIGPGEGVLTEKLLEYGGVVYIIEIDQRAIEILKQKFKKEIDNKKLFIINKNCLEIDYNTAPLSTGEGPGVRQYVLVGNIPYYITGAIFRHTFEQKILPLAATFLVQKEVAQRIVAIDKKESILSISVKIFSLDGNVKIIDIVKAGSFSPAPKVDSAILQISNIENPFKNKSHYDSFFKIMKAAFKQKRKFALGNIKHILGQEVAEELRKYFTEKQRAEDVSLETWKKIIKEF